MIGLWEIKDIHLDAAQFVYDDDTHRIAIVVANHAEKRRAEYRATEEPGAFPVADHRSIEKLGALTRHHLAHSYWSDSVPWYEWMSEPQVLQPCAMECGLNIWQLADVIAYQIRPQNWQVFSWMGVALQGLDYQELTEKSSSAMNRHIVAMAAEKKQRQIAASAAGKQSGVARAKIARCTPETVALEHRKLISDGREKREIAAILATRFNVTPDHIRKQYRKSKQA